MENIKTHIYNVRKILKCLLKYGLFMKLEKCVFGVLEISFLSFILIIKGIKIDFLQVSMIKNWLLPKSFCDI